MFTVCSGIEHIGFTARVALAPTVWTGAMTEPVILNCSNGATPRPGKARRLRLESAPEGRAAIVAARVQLGEMLADDQLSPLAALRLKKGLSVSELARCCEVLPPLISRLESGVSGTLHPTTRERLASALDVSVDAVDDAIAATYQGKR